MATVTATHANTNGAKLDPADPNVRKIVYNVYRNMLGTYNDKANGIIDQKPRELVREDKGISRQLESMILQSNQIGGGPPPPPPPPPPSTAAPGYIPGVRLNTEIGPREPPAPIQNAMMSKDKKPFTYTPGGLDLSQIRSPRMQKRISRNAQAEGVPPPPVQAPGVPRPPLGPLPPSALAAMQPQLPVAVFPTAAAPPPPPPPPPPAPQPLQVKQYSPPPPAPPLIPENYFPPPPPTPQPLQVSSPTSPGSGTGSLYVPPVQTSRAQLGSLYIPPVQQQPPAAPLQPSPPSASTSTTSPSSAGTPLLNKTTPAWLSGQRDQDQRKPQNLPPWVREEQEQQIFEQNQKPINRQPPPPPLQQQQQQQQQQQIPTSTSSSGANIATRIIPIQIEGREPPQQQQFQTRPTQSAPQRVQQPQQHQQQQPPQQQQQQTRIIPIQIEGQPPVTTSNGQRKSGNIQNKFNPSTIPAGAGQIRSPPPVSPPAPQYCESPQERVQSPRQLQSQQSWSGNNGGPVQSRSFRVLQRMTDTIDGQENNMDPSQAPQQWGPQNTQGVPVSQLRKMQLTDDDRALMNKFKAQVDGEGGSLHTEVDPRYRGAAIPSRAFRVLQTMTGEVDDPVPRGPTPGPQNKPTVPSTVENVAQGIYVPPSEQTVQEPRKYTGGAIPSRSFRMLQAMTAPENYGPGQSDM